MDTPPYHPPQSSPDPIQIITRPIVRAMIEVLSPPPEHLPDWDTLLNMIPDRAFSQIGHHSHHVDCWREPIEIGLIKSFQIHLRFFQTYFYSTNIHRMIEFTYISKNKSKFGVHIQPCHLAQLANRVLPIRWQFAAGPDRIRVDLIESAKLCMESLFDAYFAEPE